VTLFLILFLIYWFVTLVAASYRLLNKALVIIFSMSIGFAFCYGAFLEPLSLISKPVSRVTLESDKNRNALLEGKIIYDVNRYLLLLVGDPIVEIHVVAIPHEKIRSIETPPLKKPDQETLGD